MKRGFHQKNRRSAKVEAAKIPRGVMRDLLIVPHLRHTLFFLANVSAWCQNEVAHNILSQQQVMKAWLDKDLTSRPFAPSAATDKRLQFDVQVSFNRQE